MGYFNNYIVPSFFTLFLHVMVLVAVLIGWQMSDTKRYRVETPRYVKAKLIMLEQQKTRKVLVERTRPPETIKEVELPKIKRVEPRPVKKPAKTVETRKKPEQKAAAKPRPEPAVKPKTVQLPRVEPSRAEVEKKQAEQRQAEAKRAKAQRREQARVQQQEELQRALAEEEMMMQAEEDEQVVASYVALIKQRLVGTWSRPPSARKNMKVVLSIRLIPTGEVVGVEVVTSSGNLAFDRSAVIAVEKAERFPEVKKMPGSVFESYFRRFNLVFTPEDLLL